jgi:hypothetical protein
LGADRDDVYRYDDTTTNATRLSAAEARAAGLLVVDLGDDWAPFIFQDSGGVGSGGKIDPGKPNAYRQTFIDLANDRINADGRPIDGGHNEHNFLEPFGIPPTLSVLRARVLADLTSERQACEAKVDFAGLRAFTGNLGYQDRDRARRDFSEAARDASWLDAEISKREAAAQPPARRADGGGADAGSGGPAATWRLGDRAAAVAALTGDGNPKVRMRVERTTRGQERLRAVRAAQAALLCQGLLSPRSRFTPGMFDLPTHEALAEWERKNDIFGWGFLGGETAGGLVQPAAELNFETFRRVLAERVADAAGIVEDGSTAKWKTPPTYSDAPPPSVAGASDAGSDAGTERHRVPNLIDDHVRALLRSLHIADAEDMAGFLYQHGTEGLRTLRVAIPAPPLPPYYGPRMDLSVEIDRGDIWYDFPFDARGRAVQQPRERYPHVTLFVNWNGQKIPLTSWRTTIGSWRSELNANGKVYYKYKNSDVGSKYWRNIVAGPVWIPPEGTPAKDLLTLKVLDRNKGPEVVVNTDVMGPGFQSAYGLVMAIHIDKSGFDNQIRTHGSVDYTSIARRFSHGCHRLVNNRAVWMFDFVLRRQPFKRIGSIPLSLKRNLVVDNKPYSFEIKTRGYYYELLKPIPVTVTEGRIMGKIKAPITAYVRKAGVDYSDVSEAHDLSNADSATKIPAPTQGEPAPSEAESQ